MNRIMLPSAALLDTDSSPFRLGQEATLGESLGKFLGEDHMPVASRRKGNNRECLAENVRCRTW